MSVKQENGAMDNRIMMWMGMLLMVLAGCGGNRNDRLLESAETCMEARADSARWLLQQVDSALTHEQRARYALLWTQAQHKCHIPLGGDSLINVAVAYYRQVGNAHLLAKSLLYKGLVYKQHGQVEQAVEAFVASEQAFEGVEDNQYKALLFNHYAALLYKQHLFNESLDYYKKSYQCKLQGDSVHYVVSTCNNIATIYELVGQIDSAQSYYERGLSYVGVENKKLLHNYAVFLVNQGKYAEAEEMLRNSKVYISDTTYIYNVYSSLATLYYETGRYEKALSYAESMLDSQDSLMQYGGFLHLYRIHKKLGNLEKAVHYHDLYRRYDSDITLRRKTAQVAAIPHRVKNVQLMEENRTAHRWQWVWAMGVVAAVGISLWVVKRLRRKHGRQLGVKDALLDEQVQRLDEKELLLAEKQALLQRIEQKMYDLNIELGRMKGALSNQSKAVANLKEGRQKDKKAYQASVKELKANIREMEKQWKNEQDSARHDYKELKRQFEASQKEQRQWIDGMKELNGQMEQYELLQRYLLDGGDVRPVLLILELKSGKTNQCVSIRHQEYAGLLKQLAEYAYPGIGEKIGAEPVLKGKPEMACLLALGYDDMTMLRMATNLKGNSVRKYRRLVNEVLDKVIRETR